MPYRKPGSQKGHGVRAVGGKLYNRLPSEVTVAEKGEWILVAVPELDEDGWCNFKIFVDSKAHRKRMWPTGVKDGRVARGPWIERQMAKHDGLYVWASLRMKAYEERARSKAGKGANNGR